MSYVLLANVRAIGAVPVVFVAMLTVIVLLCVRAVSAVARVPLSRSVSQILGGSIIVSFILFAVLAVLRFKIIG
ncbi:MAG: hypothetical protein WAK12_01395 [Acidimicrobiales bacterium]